MASQVNEKSRAGMAEFQGQKASRKVQENFLEFG